MFAGGEHRHLVPELLLAGIDVAGATSPYLVNINSGPKKFFRLRSQPFQLTSSYISAGTFYVTGAGIPGCNFIIQASTNLANWTSFQTNTATFDLPANLSDANYMATLLHGGVKDLPGNAVAADYVQNFFILTGDLNGDRQVTIADFITLASNFNKTGVTWSEGDLNCDNAVTISDFIDLSSHFGQSLPAPAPAPQFAASSAIVSNQPVSHRHKHHRRHFGDHTGRQLKKSLQLQEPLLEQMPRQQGQDN